MYCRPPHITVGDQYTNKEIIKQGMGWVHMPHFLIEEGLRSGQLVLIDGNYAQGVTIEIGVARQSHQEHGKMAEYFWQLFE